MEYTNRQLIAEIKDACTQLDGEKSIPSGLTKMRKADLQALLTDLRSDLQARRDRKARFAAQAEEDTVEAKAAADPQAREVAVRMGLVDETPEQLTREEMRDLWDDEVTTARTFDEGPSPEDQMWAEDLSEFYPEGSVDPVPAGLVERVQFAAKLPITTTNVAAADVAVVVQSGTKLVWGKLINVVNRRTRYLPALLVTVELESGVRQLLAADDILAA